MENRFPAEQLCMRTDRYLNEVLTPAFAYADRKKLTMLPFRRFTGLNDRWLEYPEGWEGQTELTLPMLTSGAAIANSDAHGRAYYSGNDAELPEIPTSTRTAAPWAHSAYIQSFDSERVRLHRLDAAGGRLVVAIPVTR